MKYAVPTMQFKMTDIIVEADSPEDALDKAETAAYETVDWGWDDTNYSFETPKELL